MKTLQELTLLDRFLFDETFDCPEAHEAALQIILSNDELKLLDPPQTEKELRTVPWLKSVRLDVYAVGNNSTVYNTEMQKKYKNDLLRRSRYYQAVMDSTLLEPGSVDYNKLYDSCVILIMPFDLFGKGLYRYTFKGRCLEMPELTIEDGAVRIFLNTKGTNDCDVPRELVEFLHYVEKTDDESALQSDSERIQKIHAHVKRIRASEEMGVKFMNSWEEKMYAREEGKMEGRAEGRADAVIQVLEEYGDVPVKLRDEIMSEQDLERIAFWLKTALHSDSIEKFAEQYSCYTGAAAE